MKAQRHVIFSLWGDRKLKHLGKGMLGALVLMALVPLLYGCEHVMEPYRWIKSNFDVIGLVCLGLGFGLAMFLAVKGARLAPKFTQRAVIFLMVLVFSGAFAGVMGFALLSARGFIFGETLLRTEKLQAPYDRVFLYTSFLSDTRVALSVGRWPIEKIITTIPRKSQKVTFTQYEDVLYVHYTTKEEVQCQPGMIHTEKGFLALFDAPMTMKIEVEHVLQYDPKTETVVEVAKPTAEDRMPDCP